MSEHITAIILFFILPFALSSLALSLIDLRRKAAWIARERATLRDRLGL